MDAADPSNPAHDGADGRDAEEIGGDVGSVVKDDGALEVSPTRDAGVDEAPASGASPMSDASAASHTPAASDALDVSATEDLAMSDDAGAADSTDGAGGDDVAADTREDSTGDLPSEGVATAFDVANRTCSPTSRFQPPTSVPGLDTMSTNSTRLSPDELSAYTTLGYWGGYDIAHVSRASRDQAFRAPTFLNTVNSSANDGDPVSTADGLTLYMSSTRSGGYALYVATRNTTNADFSVPVALTDLNVYGEGNPYLSSDGRRLYFHSWRDGTADVYYATRTPTGFDAPVKLSVSTNTLHELDPVVSPDELTMYYCVAGTPGALQDGVWMATRPSIDRPFAEPLYLGELSVQSNASEPQWVSPDGCRLYFTVTDASKRSWLYVAERAR
jgi:hypothetical protein